MNSKLKAKLASFLLSHQNSPVLTRPWYQSPERCVLLVIGLALLGVILVSSFFKANHNHFEMHTNAARAFLGGISPYAKSLNDSASGGYASWWLYSPTAGLAYYPFSLPPPSIGLFLYLTASLALFIWGIFSLLRQLGIPYDRPGMIWFYLPAFSELVGALQSEKLEVSMVGMIALAGTQILRGNFYLGGLCLALPTVWKVQPLAIVGLVFLALFRRGGEFRPALRFGVGAALGILIFLALPVLFLPWSFLQTCGSDWLRALREAVDKTWHGNITLFNFLRGYIGYPRNPNEVRVVAAIVAALFAAATFFGWRGNIPRRILLALALGSIFGVICSPLSQGTTFVFGTPALLLMIVLYLQEGRGRWLLLTHWILTSIIWSELCPEAIKQVGASWNVRPLGFIAIALYLSGRALLSNSESESSRKSS